MNMRVDNNQEKRDLAGDYLRKARRKNILLAVLLLVLLVAAVWGRLPGGSSADTRPYDRNMDPFFEGNV